MAAKIICDGCKREAPMIAGADGHWHKPSAWYSRADKDGIQDACSRDCIDKIAKETGKTQIILPI